MAGLRHIWTNFTAGEFSDLMDGRVDFQKYANACKTLENFVVYPHGPVTKRPGWRFAGEAKYAGYPVRMVPFRYSVDQSYMLEFGHEYFRVYSDNGQVVVEGDNTIPNGGDFTTNIASWAASNSATLTNVASGTGGGGCMQIQENGADDPGAYCIANLLAPHGDYELRYQLSSTGTWEEEYVLNAASLSTNSLNDWNAANLVDNDITTVGFRTNGCVIGAYARIDFAPNTPQLTKVSIYTNDPLDATEWQFQWSDDAVTWTNIGTVISVASGPGWHEGSWAAPGAGHRYWQLYKTNPADFGGNKFHNELKVFIGASPAANTATAIVTVYDETNGTLGPELVTNGTFEAGVGNWASVLAGTITQDTSVYNTGTASAKIVTNGPGAGVQCDGFAMVGGVTAYLIRLWLWVEEGYQRLNLTVIDGNGVGVIHDEEIDGLVVGEWNHIRRTVVSYDAGANARLRILGHEDSISDTIWVDDVSAKRVTGTGAVLATETVNAVNNWGQNTIDVTLPLNCDGVRVLVACDCASGSGDELFLDDVELVRTDEPYEVETPYAYDDVSTLQFTQSADVMILTHDGYAIRQASRIAVTPTFQFGTYNIASIDASFHELNTATTGNYPSCCLYFENRLIFARTPNNPVDIWMSEDGDFDDFGSSGLGTDAINVSLASDEINQIQWLRSGLSVMVGTSGGEWTVGSDQGNEAITPSNICAKQQKAVGSADHMAVQVGNTVLFLQFHRRKIVKLAYNWESDGYIAPDLSVLSSTITHPHIDEIVFQKEPLNILWAVRSDGTLIGMTYNEEHEVIGWHRHPSDHGLVKALGVIPGENEDQVWACWEREITDPYGTFTRRNIEYLSEFFDGDDCLDACFLDSAIEIETDTPITSVAAPDLWPMAGNKASALIDGTTVTTVNIASTGAIISMDSVATKIVIGHPYTATLQPMRPEINTQAGTSQGRKKVLGNVVVRFYKTIGGRIGQSLSSMRDIVFKVPDDAANDAGTALFSGDIDPVAIPGGGISRDGYVIISHDDPMPITVCAIIGEVEVK